VAALAAADDFAAVGLAGVNHTQVPAAALAATQAAILGFFLFVFGFHVRFFRWSSAKLTRCFSTATARLISAKEEPCTEAATAQPTRQSNQWLSPRSGRCFHSSTVRPRPSVLTR
jgi:hypothetical protein